MPQLKLIEVIGVLLALAALIAGLVYAYKAIDGRGYGRGIAEERALWQARETEELQTANAEILRLTTRARALERAANKSVMDSNDARRRADEAETRLLTAVNTDVRAGLERLCGPAPGTPSQEATGGAAGATPGATGRTDGASEAGLFGALADFLAGEAHRANTVARKLAQAQDLIRLDRATCNVD